MNDRTASTQTTEPARTRRWVAPLALALLTALAYANAAPRDLVYDDNAVLVQNPGFDGVRDAGRFFRQSARPGAGNRRLYRPLAMATLAVDRSLYGFQARGYHLTSIGLHVLATLAVFFFLLALGALRRGAFLAALLFGVHPIHTEVVDVAYNRSEILATLAVVAALAWLWRWLDRRPGLAWGGAAVLYFLGLLCRESAVTLPLLAVLGLVVMGPATIQPSVPWRDRLRRLAPVAVLAVPLLLYLGMRQLALGEPAGGIAQSLRDAGTVAQTQGTPRLALLASTLRDYWRMMVWPWPLRASYEDYAVGGVRGALLLHALLIGGAIALRRRAPALTFGVLFFYLALLPSTRLFSDPAVLAERFVYLPSAGLALPLAFGAGWLARRLGQGVATGLGLALAAGLALLTLTRNQDWWDRQSLWQAEVRVSPSDPRALLNLCEARIEQRFYEEALILCERGAALAPGRPGFETNRGIALAFLGRYPEAEAAFKRALEQNGGASADHANLARLYLAMRRFPEAEEAYRQAAEREEQPALRRAFVGEMLLRCRRDLVGARAEFEAALALAPGLRPAVQGLRSIDRAEGKPPAPDR
jgi:protein O-mannosyl-transferase